MIGDGNVTGEQLTLEERKECVKNAMKFAMICQQEQVHSSDAAGKAAQEMMGGDSDWWASLLTVRQSQLSAEQHATISGGTMYHKQ